MALLSTNVDGKAAGTIASSGLLPFLDAVEAAVLVVRGDRILMANRSCSSLLGQREPGLLFGRSLSGVLDARAVGERAKKSLLLWLLEGKTSPEARSESLDLVCGAQEIASVSITRRVVGVDLEGPAVVTITRLDQPAASHLAAEPAELPPASRLSSVGQLASGAAQGVNNPLAYIASNVTYSSERLKYISDLLDDSSSMQVSDPRTLRGLLLPVLEALGEAHVGAGRASRLIKDLRSLIEPDVTFCPVDVRATLEAALNMADSEVSLRARLRADLDANGFVLGNTTRLTQLFLSMIVARAHALESGNPQRFRIDVRSRTEGDSIVVSVSDNGRAVAELEDGASGEPAFGPPASDVRPGLAICKHLAESLQGFLEVENSPDLGTVVTVRLPLTDASRKEPVSKLSPVRPGQRTRVLIVDNEPLIIRALSRLLRGDYDVETAGGGHEALDLLRHTGPFDLVLCDLAMPEMSGIELFQETVQFAPDMGPRFVFVTGGPVGEGVHAVLAGLPNRILEKPIQPEVLREVVGQLRGTRAPAP